MSTDIRPATAEDMPALLLMGREFVEAAWEIPFDRASAKEYLSMIMDNGVILLAPGGMLGALLAPAPFNAEWLVAQEVFWWVRPGASIHVGMDLFAAFEAWADQTGAEQIVVSTVAPQAGFEDVIRPEKVAAFYARRGYTWRESAFARRL